MGELPTVTAVFPPSVATSSEAEVHLIGYNLAGMDKASIKPDRVGDIEVLLDMEKYRSRKTFKILVTDGAETRRIGNQTILQVRRWKSPSRARSAVASINQEPRIFSDLKPKQASNGSSNSSGAARFSDGHKDRDSSCRRFARSTAPIASRPRFRNYVRPPSTPPRTNFASRTGLRWNLINIFICRAKFAGFSGCRADRIPVSSFIRRTADVGIILTQAAPPTPSMNLATLSSLMRQAKSSSRTAHHFSGVLRE